MCHQYWVVLSAFEYFGGSILSLWPCELRKTTDVMPLGFVITVLPMYKVPFSCRSQRDHNKSGRKSLISMCWRQGMGDHCSTEQSRAGFFASPHGLFFLSLSAWFGNRSSNSDLDFCTPVILFCAAWLRMEILGWKDRRKKGRRVASGCKLHLRTAT